MQETQYKGKNRYRQQICDRGLASWFHLAIPSLPLLSHLLSQVRTHSYGRARAASFLLAFLVYTGEVGWEMWNSPLEYSIIRTLSGHSGPAKNHGQKLKVTTTFKIRMILNHYKFCLCQTLLGTLYGFYCSPLSRGCHQEMSSIALPLIQGTQRSPT